jgi:hypothetical protein
MLGATLMTPSVTETYNFHNRSAIIGVHINQALCLCKRAIL